MLVKYPGLSLAPSSPSVPSSPCYLPSLSCFRGGYAAFNGGQENRTQRSLVFGQHSAKWCCWPIFAIFLFCNGRGPGKPWDKEVRELIYSFSHVPLIFLLFLGVALSNGLTGRLASLPYFSALHDAFLQPLFLVATQPSNLQASSIPCRNSRWRPRSFTECPLALKP